MRQTSPTLALCALIISVFIFTFNQTAAAQSALDGFDPNADGQVNAIVVQPDGKILIGGNFTTVLGVTRNRIARLNTDGTLDTTFNPNASLDVYSIALQSDGKILVGGVFNGANSIGGQTRNRIARLDPITGLADSWNPNAQSFVNSIVVQADGKILVGGAFFGANSIGGQTRNRIARLDATTGLADSFDPNANNQVTSLAVQSDGKVLAGGTFTTIGGQTRNRIARLDASSGLADSWNPNADGSVSSIAVQPDGKILVGGGFTGIGGQTRIFIARLDASTGLADSFNPNANNPVNSIAVQSDGKILAGGLFTTIGGQARNRIARLDGITGLADSWNPASNNSVQAIAVQSDGKILAGGAFNTIGGQTRNSLARLDGITGAADSFNPNSNSNIYSIAVQSDGKILAGGLFNNIGGQTRNRIARLDAATGAADSFDPNANSDVYSIAMLSDGKVLVGGLFTTVGGQSRTAFARLSNDTPALSTLSVTQSTLSLTRDGSGAQFSRVIFEQSIDNGANWTTLGTATNSFVDLGFRSSNAGSRNKSGSAFAPNASGYTLTGQNIPTGQNVLIRARGFYKIGFQNGSETTEDKVRQVYLFPLLAANVSISGRVVNTDGNGIRNVVVSLTDSNGNTRTVKTSAFGYYNFDDVEAGGTYIVNVRAKRFTFANPSQIISVKDSIDDLNFVAE